jgi:TonB-linked SusC/RagA family outer membrane protein
MKMYRLIRGDKGSWTKKLRILKLTVILLSGSLVAMSASSYSQNTNLKQKGAADPATAMQQGRKITGKVFDSSGNSLTGVSVVVKGTTNGTTTDANGNFFLNNVPADAVLVFSFIGMKSQEVKSAGKETFNIRLVDETIDVDEVVVMGYTRQNRRDVSSSVAKVDMKALENNTQVSLVSMLAGQAAGVQAILRSGTPGASGNGLVIRGNTSLSAADGLEGISNPLYIVDGMPMSLQDLAGFDVSQNDFLSTLNPNEIKSIDILKDAAATAIYGSRGANGVIVITTKRGVSGEPRFTSSATFGTIMAPEKLKVFTGEAERAEKLRLYGETMTNLFGDKAWVDVRNGLEVMGYMLPSVLTDKYNPAFNNAYDFQKMFYQSGLTQNYDLSMDGGTDKSSYRIGLGHYDEKGVLVGYGFQRTTLNASMVNDISRYIHNDFSLRYSYLDRQGGLNSYMKAMPSTPTNLPSSLYYRTPEEISRMSGQLGDAYNKNKTHSLSLGDALRFKLTSNLSLDNQASVALNFGSNDYFIPSTARADNKSYGQSQSSVNSTFNASSVLNFHKEFNDHRITALAGTEINSDVQQMSWIQADNGTSDYLKVIQGFQKENIDGYSNIVTTNMLSYFGMASYGFKDNKYQVEGVVRRDASSRFGANNKWATFPSIKAHWVFSKEPWLAGSSSWLDFGKIRASYGSSGSIAGDPLLQYNSLISTNNIGAGMNDIYRNKMDVKTYGGQTVVISDFNRVSNKGLSWSKSNEINFGIDLELFKKRLFVTGDIYSKYISGLVYTSYLPQNVGFTSIQSNLVDMINHGYELNVTAYLFPRTSNFQWEWTVNLAKNNSVIAKLGNGGRDYINGDYAFVVGRSAFQYYTYEYTGTLNSFDDLPVNPVTGNPMKYYGGDAGLALGLQGRIFPGMPMFTDVNGDYQIDAADYGNDKKIIENKSPEPKIMGGLHTTIRYKDLSLRIQSSFAFGNYIFNTTLQEQLSKYDDNTKFFTDALYQTDDTKFWKKPGDGSYYPMRYISYADGGSVRAFRRSSMFLEKGDYWSIDNVTLSYNLPKSLLSVIKLRGLNLYGTAQNVFMYKASSVLDPRTVSKTGYYNGDGYPMSRSFIVGLKLQF